MTDICPQGKPGETAKATLQLPALVLLATASAPCRASRRRGFLTCPARESFVPVSRPPSDFFTPAIAFQIDRVLGDAGQPGARHQPFCRTPAAMSSRLGRTCPSYLAFNTVAWCASAARTSSSKVRGCLLWLRSLLLPMNISLSLVDEAILALSRSSSSSPASRALAAIEPTPLPRRRLYAAVRHFGRHARIPFCRHVLHTTRVSCLFSSYQTISSE